MKKSELLNVAAMEAHLCVILGLFVNFPYILGLSAIEVNPGMILQGILPVNIHPTYCSS